MTMRIKCLAVLFLEIASVVMGCRIRDNDSIFRHKSQEIKRTANLHKSYALKSIQSDDGDVIECIDIYKQPAFNHPALRNHRIQMTPSYNPTMGTTAKTETLETPQQRKGDCPTKKARQRWQRSGSCPDGTIPIRKMQKKTQDKASPIDSYARKKPRFFKHDGQSEDEKDIKLLQTNHSLAIIHTEGYAYYGAKGDITVWNPQVELDDEYSTSQVSLRSGSYNNYEEIESGWAVNPSVYGDRQTRLFVYWTDQNTSNWWVQYQESINIGYWPAEIFSLIRIHAETVQWGGEVYSTRVGTHPHTATGMGSGDYSDFIFGNSGSVTRTRVLQNSELLKPNWLSPYSDEYDCYNYYLISDYVEDPEFYYGGPGRNYRCP